MFYMIGFHCNTSHLINRNRRSIIIKNMMSLIPKRQHKEVFDQVYHEMLDKRNWQMRLEDRGIGEASRIDSAHEIKERLEQLKKLDCERALEIVRNLGSSCWDVRRSGPLLS